MDRKAILEYLGEDWTGVEALIRSSLYSDISLLKQTNETILAHSGKMLRPMLSLLMARACGGGVSTADSVRYAASVELLHNATLLHDDVADRSETRRGVPTVASLLGDTPSVLVGDFWLVKAVEAVLDSDHRDQGIIKRYSHTLSNLAEGEMLQLEMAESGKTTEEDYMRIISFKTASLFEVACISAAVSVDAPQEVIDAAAQYAENLGLAFQIKDDILDYEGGDIGKPVGMDLKERKITLPLLGALIGADAETDALVRRKVCEIEAHPEDVAWIMDFVKERNGVAYAEKCLRSLCDKAIEALEPLAPGQATTYLKELARYTADRTK